ncbi:hypothetical protein EMCRGX_G004257 [Ephydatia muelleri]
MGRSVLAALEVRNLTARKLVADLGARDLLVRIMIHTSYSGSTYNTQEDISDASVLLNKFNTGGDGQEKVWDGYCLAHLFTYWVLSNGLLGLSNIASPSATTTGGICSTRLRLLLQLIWDPNNTALSSYTSSSNPLVFVEEVLVTGHEIGHSWGSYHDPATTPSCSNVFIMNQCAQDGSQPTYKMFSNCSRTSIGAVLSAKAQNCFTVRETGVCGDYVVTSGEQCDAGLLGDTCWTDACQLRSTAMCRSLPVFLHWIPTFNIHLCNKNGGGHQGTLDYTMTMWKTMLKRCQLKRTPYGVLVKCTDLGGLPKFRFQAQWGPPDAQREERRELEVLYLLDKYGVSDAFYQALSMKCDSLPRASKVKAARWEFNKTVEQFSIPTFDGSYRHVEMAIREEITRLSLKSDIYQELVTTQELPSKVVKTMRPYIKGICDWKDFQELCNTLSAEVPIHPDTIHQKVKV